jgi:hypothetical protein
MQAQYLKQPHRYHIINAHSFPGMVNDDYVSARIATLSFDLGCQLEQEGRMLFR